MRLNEKTMQKASVVISLAVLANLLWGSAPAFIKTGYAMFRVGASDTAAQILFAGCRFFLAGILAVILGSLLAGRPLLPTKTSWSKIGALAIFQTIVQYVFFYIGCAHAAGYKVSIACSTGSFITILFSALLFRQEKLTAKKLLGCVLGFSGVVLVNLSGSGLNLDVTLLGEGFIIISACSFALSGALTKSFSKTEDPVMLCGWQFIFGGAVMICAGLVFGGRLAIPGASGILLILYLALVSAVAFSLNSILIKFNPVSRVSIFGFLNPVFGVMLSILMLKESGQEFGVRGIIALLLVCAGVLVVNFQKREKAK